MRLDEIGLKHGTDKASRWHDYLKVYEQIMPVHEPVSLLEIGWFDGASVKTWRDYLHVESTIVGVDIGDKEMIPGVHFRQVDATSVKVVKEVSEFGPFDFIIDDGSHLSPDVIATFLLLWSQVKPGGYYIVEDLHVSYHRDWLGNPDPDARGTRGETSMQFLRRLADDVHFGHAGAGPNRRRVSDVGSIAFYPGLAVIRKKDA